MDCEAIIFDLDGTLVDTLEDIADSANQALQGLGVPTHSVQAYRLLVGGGIRRLMERALPEERRGQADIEEGVARMRAVYSQRWAQVSRPYPGIPELLDALTARGMPMGVLSNKPHDFTVEMVRTLLGRWTFAAVQGATADVPLKPNPAGALALAGALRVPAARCALLGDSDVDIQTARRAKMLALGAAWGFRGAAELRAAGADHVLDAPGALLTLFP
ncbi:MAG: HAD family hydrolase [Deltaproteobacteria bacterium]|nr:HAD family hydrolase [Deltaproteobacteria bacterium]